MQKSGSTKYVKAVLNLLTAVVLLLLVIFVLPRLLGFFMPFVVGWIIQFVGHYWEGRKPAFFDDIVGLLIGPLFVLAEMGFALGLRKEVQPPIEQRSGPVRTSARAAL